MTTDHLEELASLTRLADLLNIATAGEVPAGIHAMAKALAVRLNTLSGGITHDMTTMMHGIVGARGMVEAGAADGP